MSFCCLTLTADAQNADMLCDLFIELGAMSAGIHYSEEAMLAAQGLPEGNGDVLLPVSGDCRVTVLAIEEAGLQDLIKHAGEILQWEEVPVFSIEKVPEQDWVRLSQNFVEPLSIGDKLWILPSWETPPRPDAICLRLDPGAAFGTGSHPTTRLCLERLLESIRGEEKVLDYGCGSGILSIAALRLGAAEAIGIDHDPQALHVSQSNAALNKVALAVYTPREAPDFNADLVVANLLAKPLIKLAPALAGYTQEGGELILSGILAEQEKGVRKVFESWFDFLPAIHLEGWSCLHGRRKISS